MEQIQKWLDSNYKNYLKKNLPLDKDDLDHILDWMKSKDAERYLNRLDRISPPQALEMSKKWTEKLIKEARKNIDKELMDKGVETVKELDGGFKIVKLVEERSFQLEGLRMGHCVASYFDHHPKVDIFSLRDKNNNPHCTIEYDPKEKRINQIKGKGNKEVSKKYHKPVRDFLNSFEFDSIYTYDIKNISSVYFGTYFLDSDDFPKDLTLEKSLNIELVNFKHTFDTLEIKGDAKFLGNRRCVKIAKKLIIHGDLVIERYHDLLMVAEELIVEGSIELINCENIRLISKKLEADYLFVEKCSNFRNNQSEVEVEISSREKY